jgi:hypothetical protein
MVWKENRNANIKFTVNNSAHMNANLVISANRSQTIHQLQSYLGIKLTIQYKYIYTTLLIPKVVEILHNKIDQKHNNSPREETYR